MTFEVFDRYHDELLAKVKGMRDTKGKEYANSEDRFANFNRIAQRQGITRLQVASVYLTKHLDGIESFVKNGRTYSDERIEGRIVDAITYLSLIAGMIREDESSQSEREKKG